MDLPDYHAHTLHALKSVEVGSRAGLAEALAQGAGLNEKSQAPIGLYCTPRS